MSGTHCGFGGHLVHSEMVSPGGVEEGGFNQRSEQCSSQPRTSVKELAYSVVGNFAKAGEWGLSGDSAESCIWNRLEQLCGSHRFTKSENTVRMLMLSEPGQPLMDIVTLE